jgi:hypothetical protein
MCHPIWLLSRKYGTVWYHPASSKLWYLTTLSFVNFQEKLTGMSRDSLRVWSQLVRLAVCLVLGAHFASTTPSYFYQNFFFQLVDTLAHSQASSHGLHYHFHLYKTQWCIPLNTDGNFKPHLDRSSKLATLIIELWHQLRGILLTLWCRTALSMQDSMQVLSSSPHTTHHNLSPLAPKPSLALHPHLSLQNPFLDIFIFQSIPSSSQATQWIASPINIHKN